MAKTPTPPDWQHPIAGTSLPDQEWFAFFKQQADAIRDLQQRLSLKTTAAYPVAADIPAGEVRVWKNSSTGIVRLYANDGGTLKFVALS